MRETWGRGFSTVVEEALETAHQGTRAVYPIICSDISDAAVNPGGPPDFDGLSPHELFQLVHRVAFQGIRGLGYGEIYPLQDSANRSSHLAVWFLLDALAGMALRGDDPGGPSAPRRAPGMP
jgi:agmatinase